MASFATAFNQADVLIVTEVYPAGEQPIPGVSGKTLYGEIQQFGHKNVHFEPNMKKIPLLLKKLVKPKDLILVQGAGSIYKIIPDIIACLEDKT
jgi:UDP-N-acetylmuramate--alanine ligase